MPLPDALTDLLDPHDPGLFEITTHAPGPAGSLPLTPEILRNWASGDLFGMTQAAAMGWNPPDTLRSQVLIISTLGGLRAEDGSPLALGFHTGHWELGLLVKAAAGVLKEHGALPFAAYCSDPCDGRTQGTKGMMDSLAWRNDAAMVMRRQIRSLPQRRAVIGIATCDKGLPAMMMALVGARPDLPVVLVPGGVTLPADEAEDAGTVQTISARYSLGHITLEHAADMGCRACGSAGGGCQFLGTAATSQVVGEALGLSLPHSALAPSGQPIWVDLAERAARAAMNLVKAKIPVSKVVTDGAIRNAMTVHAAFGGSTNLLLHIPAIAHAAGLERPTVEEWSEVNRATPRLVSVLPNGPVMHPTVRVFLAGGVPEVMLHLRVLGLLDLGVLTATGHTLGQNLEWWEKSERRERLREHLREADGVDPDEVVMAPAAAKKRGLTSTVTFPSGNIAPQGAVIKSTAIDPSVIDGDGVYRHTGPVRFFTSEAGAIEAVKGGRIAAGDVMVLTCLGPLGAGLPETAQITIALKNLPFGKHVALLTDGRFSGVSTGACIGHIGPEAMAGGPIGKLRENDTVRIEIDTVNLRGAIDFIAPAEAAGPPQRAATVSERSGASKTHAATLASPASTAPALSPERAAAILNARPPHPNLRPDPDLPDDTLLWAKLQNMTGGTWGGCVYDHRALTPDAERLAIQGDSP